MSTETLPAPVFEPADHERGDLLWDPAAFVHGQRVATMFASSQLIPQHLRGKVADVLIGLHMARRMHEDPLTVLQSIYVVHGKPGWSAQYMIARANRSGVFRGPLRWRESGRAGADDYAVTCYATLAETGEDVDFTTPYQMAVAEGWAKQNPKYRSMPQLMLRYRSATMLVRLYAPEVMLGLQTVEEIRDVGGADEVVVAPERIRIEPDVYITPEPTPAPAPAPARRGMAALRQAVEAPKADPDAASPAMVEPTPKPAPETEPIPEPPPAAQPKSGSPTDRAALDAEVVQAALRVFGGDPVQEAILRKEFCVLAGVSRVSEARWQMAARAAARAGHLRKVGEGLYQTTADQADYDGPTGEDLVAQLIEAEQVLVDVADDAGERIARARQRSGCAVVLEADEAARRRYWMALEDEIPSLGEE
jgi:hypothetical protein